jgi:hypothetical protein
MHEIAAAKPELMTEALAKEVSELAKPMEDKDGERAASLHREAAAIAERANLPLLAAEEKMNEFNVLLALQQFEKLDPLTEEIVLLYDKGNAPAESYAKLYELRATYEYSGSDEKQTHADAQKARDWAMKGQNKELLARAWKSTTTRRKMSSSMH